MAARYASSNPVIEPERAPTGRKRARRWAEPRRICFPFAGGLVGGSHLSALKLIQSLDRTQFAPLVLLHSLDGSLADLLRREGLEPELAPTPHHLGLRSGSAFADARNFLRSLGAMTRFLRDRDVTIVHTNEGAMHATWTLPAKLAGARHVWHHRGNASALGLRLLAPLFATRVVSVSQFAAPRPGAWSARGKCSVVYSPFDTSITVDRDVARQEIMTRLGLAPETRLLAFVGQFSERKRPLILIDTIAKLRADRPELPIVALVLGEEFEPGLEQKMRERIAAHGLEDTVRLLGFQRPIEPWIAASDALVVPAVQEPFGRTLIEAMLLGTPVIAASDGGNVEAIRHRGTGLLARPDDPRDFAHRIVELLGDSELAGAIAHRARQEALRKFGVSQHTRRITEIYHEALAT